MKVRGGRRRHGQRASQVVADVDFRLFARLGEAASSAVGVFAEMGRAWGAIFMSALERVTADVCSEEERATRDLGEHLGLSEALVADVVAQTHTHTPCTPTDWAIARANLSALAGMTKI
jgi:hypothetical protein